MPGLTVHTREGMGVCTGAINPFINFKLYTKMFFICFYKSKTTFKTRADGLVVRTSGFIHVSCKYIDRSEVGISTEK